MRINNANQSEFMDILKKNFFWGMRKNKYKEIVAYKPNKYLLYINIKIIRKILN